MTLTIKISLWGWFSPKKKITILVSANDRNLDLAVRNLKNVHLVDSKKASAYDLIDCDIIVAEKSGLELLNNQLSVA